MPQASIIASPMPVRLDSASTQPTHPLNSSDQGRDTPLPQYERTQSVPFSLNLQEDPLNPGRFQLVVNLESGPHAAKSISLPPSNLNLPNTVPNDSNTDKLVPSHPHPSSPSALYRTQRPTTPSTSPTYDSKTGWSDLSSIPPNFLQKVVPDWQVTFARSDSSATAHSRALGQEQGQSKRLADIKARIKKKGKGYVVRLLRGGVGGEGEVAEVDLGKGTEVVGNEEAVELGTEVGAMELESTEIDATPTRERSRERTEVFEIGTSGELGIAKPVTPRETDAVTRPRIPALDMYIQAARNSIADESLSDAETLIPDRRPLDEQMESTPTDVDTVSDLTASFPSRTSSVTSIVKTPTRGLSVVGPVRRVVKINRMRTHGKAKVSLDLRRSDAHKSVKHRSPRGSVLDPSSTTFSNDQSTSSDSQAGPVIQIESIPGSTHLAAEMRHRRHVSAISVQEASKSDACLRLNTDVPPSRSAKTSPVLRRKKNTRAIKSAPASPSDSSSGDEIDGSSPVWSEINASHELREALDRAFNSSSIARDKEVGNCTEELPVPQINEPARPEHIGEVVLPSELEIRSAPVGTGSTLMTFWSLALGELLEQAHQGLEILGKAYGAEPLVPKDHVRVRWTCSCGEQLYDDFVEKRPGAARWLEAYLNRPRSHAPPPTGRSSTASSVSSIFDASSRTSTLATPSSTYGGPSSWKSIDSAKYSPSRLRTNSPFSVRMPSFVEESWLLTCANEGRFTPKVVHLDVNKHRIKSDKDLALALREHYDQLNSRWFNWLRVRGLNTIEFVQFEIHRNRFADIRAAPSMPPSPATTSVSASDPETSSSPSQHPYVFEPIDLMPPVGSTYLLHLFKHPADYDGELITYLRSPKRRSRLDFGMGWGINLVEGFLAQRVWLFTMGIMGLASAAFAVMWTIRKGDVQGAFGVAQWVLGLAALVVGGMQAWLE